MKLLRKNQNENRRTKRVPLDVRHMERLLAHISCHAGLAGFSAAAFALGIWHCLLWLLYGNDAVILIMTKRQITSLITAGAISCALLLLRRDRMQKLCEVPVSVYPNAAAYWNQCVRKSPFKMALYLLLWIFSYVLSVFLPGYFLYSDLQLMLAICAAVIAFCAFHTVSLLWAGRIYGKIEVRCVPDPDGRDDYDIRGGQRKKLLWWFVYWAAAMAGYLAISAAFQSLTMYGIYFIVIAVNFLLRVMNNNPFRRFSGIRSKQITVRLSNTACTAFLVFLCLYAIKEGSNYNSKYIESFDYSTFLHDSSFDYDRETGVYTIWGTSDEFRILQLTDIHICGSIATLETDRKALTACYDLIQETQPDLVIITGDLVYPVPIQTFSKDNLGAVSQLCDLMNNIGIPWMLIYGNHDTEVAASYRAEELSGLYKYYVQQEGCPMLYAEKQPDIYGRYNQYIRLLNADGSLNRLLFLVDSNDYAEGAGPVKEYDSVHSDQIQWYEDTVDQVSEEEGRLVPSFVFMSGLGNSISPIVPLFFIVSFFFLTSCFLHFLYKFSNKFLKKY